MGISNSPAAVPQHGGTHQAEEKRVEITSSGKRVTFRWICSRFSTRAMNAPTTKRTTLRCTRCWLQFKVPLVALVVAPVGLRPP